MKELDFYTEKSDTFHPNVGECGPLSENAGRYLVRD